MELIYSTKIPFSVIISLHICASVLNRHQFQNFIAAEMGVLHPQFTNNNFPVHIIAKLATTPTPPRKCWSANKSGIVGRRFSKISSSTSSALTSAYDMSGRKWCDHRHGFFKICELCAISWHDHFHSTHSPINCFFFKFRWEIELLS